MNKAYPIFAYSTTMQIMNSAIGSQIFQNMPGARHHGVESSTGAGVGWGVGSGAGVCSSLIHRT